jgi:alpha-L-fucosidase
VEAEYRALPERFDPVKFGPLQNLPNGRTTQKGSTVYLHVFDWPNSTLEVKGLDPRVLSATLLAGHKRLPFKQEADRLIIQVPAEAADRNATVIELRTK